ncbi:MAG: DUF983 domain-containing protein [Alphaproteobacteria bacterium]|nr:DUF983 domain-containing protein [Alphaproteobacteria bacterium]
MPGMLPDSAPLRTALACKCPRCGRGELYQPGFLNVTVNDVCTECGFTLGKHDSADGPAVLLIFVLGALLVPLALAFEFLFSPPLWLHAVLWGGVAIGLTLGALRPLKAYVIALQYKHRPEGMED